MREELVTSHKRRCSNFGTSEVAKALERDDAAGFTAASSHNTSSLYIAVAGPSSHADRVSS